MSLLALLNVWVSPQHCREDLSRGRWGMLGICLGLISRETGRQLGKGPENLYFPSCVRTHIMSTSQPCFPEPTCTSTSMNWECQTQTCEHSCPSCHPSPRRTAWLACDCSLLPNLSRALKKGNRKISRISTVFSSYLPQSPALPLHSTSRM